MSERIVTFGTGAALVGVLCEPTHDPGPQTAVVFLSAGLLHRVGPHRLYVTMARRLAKKGVASLRFDFSSIGDSGPRKDGLPALESSVHEVREALDAVTRATGIEQFVLAGLCSGADNAYRAALEDARVTGLILLDWFPYRTPGYYFRHYGERLFRIQSWKNILLRTHPMWKALRRRCAADDAESPVLTLADRYPPEKKTAAAHLGQLVARGVSFLVVYTGGQPGFYNYERQFLDAFRSVDFMGKLRLEYLADVDHTFTLHQHRDGLLEIVDGWIESFVSG